jgi:antitoxin ParD1/3/4
MTIALTPDLEQRVNRHVASGRFGSPGEVIGEGLRLLDEQEELEALGLDHLRREVAVGLAQLRRGDRIPGASVFEEIRQLSRDRRKLRS